jgi:hypothetical protein
MDNFEPTGEDKVTRLSAARLGFLLDSRGVEPTTVQERLLSLLTKPLLGFSHGWRNRAGRQDRLQQPFGHIADACGPRRADLVSYLRQESGLDPTLKETGQPIDLDVELLLKALVLTFTECQSAQVVIDPCLHLLLRRSAESSSSMYIGGSLVS